MAQNPPSPTLPSALPLVWQSLEPVWIDQWPLPLEKLKALHSLVQQHLQAQRLESSTSPWNTPVFVIKKKSGAWRLLHDLREINKRIQPMGPLQFGLPNPNLIPQTDQLCVLDLKDCFFTIPLCPQDREKFAFTVPQYNNQQPSQRYQWKVLPQGMQNSPTLCQLFVDRALTPFRARYPMLKVYHYMDDILLSGPQVTEQQIDSLSQILCQNGLLVAPEKIQRSYPYHYLGHKVLQTYAAPVRPALTLPQPLTLVKLQQILGHLNWIRPYFRLPTSMLQPLFELLRGARAPGAVIAITEEHIACIRQINAALSQQFVDRPPEVRPLRLILLATPHTPTAALFVPRTNTAVSIIEWLYLSSTPPRNIYPYLDALSDLVRKARHRAVQLTGTDLVDIVFPLSRSEFDSLCHTSLAWQVALCDYVGEISYNPPKDPRLVITQKVPLIVHRLSHSQPIVSAVTLFTDGSPHRGVVTYQSGDPPRWHSRFTLPQRSAQRSELAAVILAFQLFADCPFNLIVDTHYVYQVIDHLPLALITPQVDADLLRLFLSLQYLISTRNFPYFVAHIRSHTPLPGSLTEGNARADRTLRGQVNSLFSDPIESHAFFHQSASVLARQFHIPTDHARSIVRSCPHCAAAAPTFSYAVNPRGTAANQLWQMDVTQVPQFRPYSCLHVSVDTYSGFLWATPQRGEATAKVIHHLLACFSVMGRPSQIKTDNAPAYCSTALSTFCARWDVRLKHGIPYNSTGQAIVERANRTLKTLLDKQLKQGELRLRTLGDIQQQMHILLFTLNNLTLNADQQTPADRHFHKSEVLERPRVFYRQLPDPQWLGPVPLITWGRGYAAVSLPAGPLWVPARCVRPALKQHGMAPGAAEPHTGVSADLGGERGASRVNNGRTETEEA
ncbi:unnamed protein product [Natator depressus]